MPHHLLTFATTTLLVLTASAGTAASEPSRNEPSRGAAAAASGTVRVDSPADAGPGSLRAAVTRANADAAVRRIVLRPGLQVGLVSAVELSASQDVVLDGRGATISGAGADPDSDTWDSGLIVATGGGDLTVRDLAFHDSFNNGLAVFVPPARDRLTVTLEGVEVDGAQFHGILVDAQSTTGYNSDDVPHPSCTDPYPTDAHRDLRIRLDDTTIAHAGRVEGFDTSLATGCPQDFDGLRVDQGGAGDLSGRIDRSTFVANLADGVELDETGTGSVVARVTRSTFRDNGDTDPVPCPDAALGCTPGQDVIDLDDGFDIDEAGPGDLRAAIGRTHVDGNRDEGLDLDEAGTGDLHASVSRVRAAANTDEAFKASEEDAGDTVATISRSTFTGGGDDGTQVEEEGPGTVRARVDRSTIADNSKAGVNAEADDGETGSLRVRRTSLSGNASPLDLTNVRLVRGSL